MKHVFQMKVFLKEFTVEAETEDEALEKAEEQLLKDFKGKYEIEDLWAVDDDYI